MSRVSARQDLQGILQTAADGVADVVGFDVAAISYLHPDRTLEVVAVAGDDAARAQLLGTRTPIDELTAEFELAEHWGTLRFVPHERLPNQVGQGWVPDVEQLDVPDAWHPQDALFAPLSAPTGELVGLLSVDLPHDRRRPGPFQRDVLEMYALQAGIAISSAQQRARLQEEVRLAEAARVIARTAGRDLDLGRVIDDCLEPVVSGLRCHGMWIRAFEGVGEEAGRGRGATYPRGDQPSTSEELVTLAGKVAEICWHEQRSVILSRSSTPPPAMLSVEEAHTLLEYVGQTGSATMLLTPLGAGPECLGYMALTRTEAGPMWSDEEVAAALGIGRDIGRAILHARLFERERQIAEELKQLDCYKNELVSTATHELKNPLTSIIGHLEMVRSATLPASLDRSLQAIERNTVRLKTLVEDLLLFAQVEDPNRRLVPVKIDMAIVLADAVEMFRVQADQRGVVLDLAPAPSPVMTWADPVELDRAISNLISNAIKFSPDGGTVTLRATMSERGSVFHCSDQGLGISHADQERLFTEFYRSNNPAALAIPGTGLGLTIVKRIVERHNGTIDLRSAIGAGTTFSLTFPAAS